MDAASDETVGLRGIVAGEENLQCLRYIDVLFCASVPLGP
jgi:hypothetical protein